MWPVLFVAGEAICRQFLAIQIVLVAIITFDLLMLATKRELRLPIMVESDHVPFLRAMAVFTFFAVAAAMHILQLMAFAANRADALIAFTGMTGFAVDFLMRADQLEFRLRMIEGFDVGPDVLIVTIITFFAEPSFMRLVRLVAVDA